MTLFSKKKVTYAATALALGVASFSTQAYAATRIQAVSATQTSANTTQLRIRFDGTPVMPAAYQQSGSRQLVLDFNQVGTALPRRTNINTGSVSDVTSVNSGSATRLMVNMRGATTYNSRIEGNNLVVDVMELGAGASTNAPPMRVAVNPLLSPANARNNNLNNNGVSSINYANGTVNIALTNEAIPVDVQRQGNKIVVRTTGNSIPRHLLRRINAGGLVSNIDVSNQGKNGVITLNMTGDFEYQAYQSGAQLVVSVQPAKMLTEPTLEQKVYKGEALSMEFQDVPVRT
ncbi:MAG: AMIN domain-containing protein, partial [Moraxella sp.]|nr:AMIN domain-containing protein [Moraxella sp.]